MTTIPLTKSDLSNAKAGAYECSLLEQEIARQRACGLDCDECELRNEQLRKFFQAILDQYGPLVRPGSPNQG